MEPLVSRVRWDKRSDLLNAAVRQGGHPELRLIPAVFQPLRYSSPPRLFDHRQINDRADVVVIIDKLALDGAAAPRDFPKEPLARFADAVCGTARRLFDVIQKRRRGTRHLA